jgi:hypothetical protein
MINRVGCMLVLLVTCVSIAGCDGDKQEAQPTATVSRTADGTVDEPAMDGAGDGDEATPIRSADDEPASFHYVVTLDVRVDGSDEGIAGTIEGDYVAPAAHAFTQEYSFAGIQLSESYVVIGDDAWTRSGSGDWDATNAGDPDVVDARELTTLDPEFFPFDDEFVDDISFLSGQDDTRNGIETSRIEISEEQFSQLGDLFGDEVFAGTDAEGIQDLAFAVWLTRDGTRLVALEVDATFPPESASEFPFEIPPGGLLRIRMSVDLSRLNDDSITIEPPI